MNEPKPNLKTMAFLGLVALLLIAMTIAANLHPEGPLLVILLFWACPALFGGLFMLLDQTGSAARRVGGVLIMLLGVGLLVILGAFL